ncbi:hypothetical protein HispidOSU_001799, partial [Sigmodon hispidus]
KRANEPTFTVSAQARKSPIEEEGVDERGKQCRSYTMTNRYSCLEVMSSLDNTDPKRDILMAVVINTATGHFALSRNSLDHLSDNLSSPKSVLNLQQQTELNHPPRWPIGGCLDYNVMGFFEIVTELENARA